MANRNEKIIDELVEARKDSLQLLIILKRSKTELEAMVDESRENTAQTQQMLIEIKKENHKNNCA